MSRPGQLCQITLRAPALTGARRCRVLVWWRHARRPEPLLPLPTSLLANRSEVVAHTRLCRRRPQRNGFLRRLTRRCNNRGRGSRHWRRRDPRRCPSDSQHRHCLRVRRARRMSNRIPSGPGSRQGKDRMHSVHSAGRSCRQAALHATRRHRARSPARTLWAGSRPSPLGESRSKRPRSRHPAVPPASV